MASCPDQSVGAFYLYDFGVVKTLLDLLFRVTIHVSFN